MSYFKKRCWKKSKKSSSQDLKVMWVVSCLVPRPHYYAWPMRFGSHGPRKFLRPRQTRRSETFCLTWGGRFGSGRAVNNFSAHERYPAAMESPEDKAANQALLFYARIHC